MGDDRTLSEAGPSDMDGVNVTPLEPRAARLDVPVEPLRWALRSTLVAASTDETRFVLCGVHLVYHASDVVGPLACPAGTLRLASTDGHRLHVCDVYAPNAVDCLAGRAPTVERAAVAALLKVFPRPARGRAPALPPLTMSVDAMNVYVHLPTGPFRLPIIDGRFPDYGQVIPAPVERSPEGKRCGRVTVDPAYLADACACAPGRSIALHTPEDELSPMRLESSAQDVGTLTAVIMPMRV